MTKSFLIISIFVPFAVCLTLIEDIYLTNQLVSYFGDDLDGGSSSESSSERLISADDVKIASLLSSLDIKERADHYWTRLGHRTKTRTTPEYSWENYYYNNPRNNGYGLRKRRQARSIERRLKRQSESERKGEEPVGTLTKDQQINSTADLPRPMLDYKLKRGFNKCCADSEDSRNASNDNVQSTKMQCLQIVRRNRTKVDDNSTTIEGDGGLYNIFSCDRVNRWKATVTCTIDCMGQKLKMINANGEINVETTKAVLKDFFATQSWQHAVSDELIDRCYQEISANPPNAVLDKFGLKCNTKMAEFTYCLWREFFLLCPAEKQQKTRPCEKLRFVLKKNNENKFRN